MKNKTNLVVAGVLIVIAVGYLIWSSTGSSASYFMTIEEVQAMGEEAQERNLTVSGAVRGESIEYDTTKPRVTFTMVHIPGDLDEIEAQGGLATILHDAVENSEAPQLKVVYDGVKPDLLQDEAQAIVRGQITDNGTLHADEVLLKCPSRYAEDIPEQLED
jgi:cytochrome c-type biogenesis protein CcmE